MAISRGSQCRAQPGTVTRRLHCLVRRRPARSSSRGVALEDSVWRAVDEPSSRPVVVVVRLDVRGP